MRNLATPHVQQALGRLALLVVGCGRNASEPRPRPVWWLVRSALATVALGAALAAGLVLASLDPGNAVGSAVAFLAGCLFVAGAAAAVTVGVLEALRVAYAGRATDR